MKLITFLSLFMFSTVQADHHHVTIESLSTDNVEVQKMIVDKHNYYRRNVDPTASKMLRMIWNKEAARNADLYAKKCSWHHSSPGERTITNLTCGENLFFAGIPLSWETVLEIFDSEKQNYEYGKGAKSSKEPVGHYTQLVWDHSFFLGCAVAYCSSNHPPILVYVCHYCPAGNVNSLNFPYKLGKPCEECKESCSDHLCTNPCPYVDHFSNCAELENNCQNVIDNCRATCSCKSENV